MEYNMKHVPTAFEYGKIETIAPCPHCAQPQPFSFPDSQCVLNKPLMMLIPPQGVHLSCPVHPGGHHVFGPQVTY